MAEKIEVQATINLPGLRAGQDAWVDPEVPYIAGALRAGYLIRRDGAKVEAVVEDVDRAPDVEATEGSVDMDETEAVVPPDLVP